MPKWDAKDYSASSSAQKKWAEELMAKLSLRGNEHVLDIGCGDGEVTAEIASRLTDGVVVGVDSSPEMINFAREKYPQIDFKVCDARELNFNNNFDVVFSNATLHWVTDHLAVLKGIKRSIKPNGRILLQMGGRGNASGILKIAKEMIKNEKWSKYFIDFTFPYGFYGVKEYKDWLKQVGLKAKRVEIIPKDMTQKGKYGLSAWMRTTWLPYTERAPQELREEFIGELAAKYISDQPLDNNGLVHVQMVRLEVEAENCCV